MGSEYLPEVVVFPSVLPFAPRHDDIAEDSHPETVASHARRLLSLDGELDRGFLPLKEWRPF